MAEAQHSAEAKRLVSYFHCEDISVYSSVEANLLKPHILKCGHALPTRHPSFACFFRMASL